MKNLPILIGSRAMALRLGVPEAPDRDVDLIATMDQIASEVSSLRPRSIGPFEGGKKYLAKFGKTGGTIVEIEVAWLDSTAEEFREYVSSSPDTKLHTMKLDTFKWIDVLVPSLDALYALKMTHRFKKNSRHFRKTREHVLLMRRNGAGIPTELEGWFKRREAETYNYNHPNLNVTKGEFFQASGDIKYVYDHDSIHEAVKVGLKPAYTYFKEPGAQVKCSEKLFWEASNFVRLCAVLEESYVLAIERSLVPHPGGMTPKQAFDMALMKVCTSITSGWFREFAWESYDLVQSLYDDSYFERFKASPLKVKL